MKLRIALGILSALFAVGWILFIASANSFRASFGASRNGPAQMFGPVAVAVLMLATTVWPHNRPMLHAMAAVSALAIIGCVFLARETVFVASCGVLVFGLWILYYYRAIWARLS